jgi:hypothetical protein
MISTLNLVFGFGKYTIWYLLIIIPLQLLKVDTTQDSVPRNINYTWFYTDDKQKSLTHPDTIQMH